MTTVKFHEDDIPLHHLAECDKSHYEDQVLRYIQVMYIIAIIIWFLLIIFMKLIPISWVGWLILFIPIISFAFTYCFTKHQTVEAENEFGKGNFLAFVSIIALIVINWTKDGDKCKIYGIVLAAFIFLLLAMIDSWVKSKYVIVVKHFRNICEIIALALLIYAIYIYYSENICKNSP
jgi:hypothetical protein